jgi:hypothetical protein
MYFLVNLDDRQQAYLLGKIRQDVRTRRRYLARPVLRPELSENDVRAMIRRRRAELRFRENLYALLGGDPGDLVPEEREGAAPA